MIGVIHETMNQCNGRKRAGDNWITNTAVLHFRVYFNFNLLLVPSSLSSSLGAGSGKLTWKPLGAHQKRILIAIWRRTWLFLFYRPNYEPFIISCVEKFDIIRLLHQSHPVIIRVLLLLSFLNSVFHCRKQESIDPNKRTYLVLAKQRKF